MQDQKAALANQPEQVTDRRANPVRRNEIAPGAVLNRNLALPYGTTFPRDPSNRDLFFYEVPGQDITWVFRYNADSTNVYKWEFVGGGRLYQFTTGVAETTASTTYTTLTSATQLVVPIAGVYDFEWSVEAFNGTTGQLMLSSLQIGSETLGATSPGDYEAARSASGAASTGVVGVGRRRGTVSAAGLTCRLLHRVTGGTGAFQLRHLTITPVRVTQ